MADEQDDPRITSATDWLEWVRLSIADHGALMGQPHRTWDGETTLFEWWQDHRKLSAYVQHPGGSDRLEGREVELIWSWIQDGATHVESVDDAPASLVALAYLWLHRRSS